MNLREMAFQEIRQKVGEEFSGEAACRYVGEIVRHHRIQASPGFSRAASEACEILKAFGVDTRIVSYPARGGISFWGQPSFQAWEAEEGWLCLVTPEIRKLADYHDSRLALIQRSASFEGEAEIVLLDDGLEEEEYRGLDVRGKVVLTRGDPTRVHYLAVERGGAIGIIYDGLKEIPGLRHPLDLPDAREYTSFWWWGDERKCFGFVLTPKQGEDLRRLVRGCTRNGEPAPRVKAKVVGRFWDGELEVVSAFLPGESGEEVLVVAHLCHPQGAANDNASGSAALLEIARTLGTLVGKGDLRKPRRGIRFLLVPELTGTYAYLADPDSKATVVAGLNLDMVGENQELCGSTLLVERLPGPSSAFSDDLLELLLHEAAKERLGHAGAGGYASFRHGNIPFSGGSDHEVLSDPTVGIATPLLIQWPDKFYHTSLDTWDKVDPRMLALVGRLGGTYAYYLAAAGPGEAEWLGQQILRLFQARLLAEKDGRRARYLLQCKIQALRSLKKLASLDTTKLEGGAQSFFQREVVPQEPTQRPDGMKELIPHRLVPGPVRIDCHLHRLSHEDRQTWWSLSHGYGNALWYLLPLALYWCDGKRSLREIVDLIELESGRREVELTAGYFGLLAKLGLLDVEERKG